jgi:hypothetical protein
MVKYCEICERNVEPQKKFNWLAFLVLCLIGGAGVYLYIPYYFLIKQKRCPICNGRQFDKAINFKKSRRVKRKR